MNIDDCNYRIRNRYNITWLKGIEQIMKIVKKRVSLLEKILINGENQDQDKCK